MKKFLLVLAIGGFAVSCNNSGDSASKAADSTKSAQVDSVKTMADSTKSAIDSTKKMTVDSIKGKTDSLKK